MTQRFRIALALLAAAIAAPCASLQEPQGKKGPDPAPKQDFRGPNREFYKGRSTLAKRGFGVLLQATAKAAAKPNAPDEITIQWTLDYTGPRPPLIILEPTLERETEGQTAALFYAEGPDQKVYTYQVDSPSPVILTGVPDKWFLTVDKGKAATGRISIPAVKVRIGFQATWPEIFGETPPVLHVQLWHKPRFRGGDMDAWTGELFSPVLGLAVNKW
jgi:hypothetical protein